jgi:hypothetical protein
MGDVTRRIKSVRSGLWVALQALSLASILLAPIWLQWGGVKPVTGRRVPRTPDSLYAAEQAATLKPVTITSRTVTLPEPDAPPSGVLRVKTAQVRFEWIRRDSGAGQDGIRSPASKPAWSLVKIERREEKEWIDVSLLRGESNQVLGSSFLELDSGMNEFRISFKSAAGPLKSYPLRVRHLDTP